MADLADVEEALVQKLVEAVYPAGTGAPSAVGSPVAIYRGWPSEDVLQRDLKAGMCHVTISSRGGVATQEAAIMERWTEEPKPDPSMIAIVDREQGTVTFEGTATERLMIAAVGLDHGAAWTHNIIASDTPSTVAAGLATKISEDRTAYAVNEVLTIPGAARLGARVVIGGKVHRRVRSQRQGFQIIAWCPTPDLRDRLVPILDMALAEDPRMLLRDGTAAHIDYTGTVVDDGPRANPLYRRDLLIGVEYQSVARRELPPVAAIPIDYDDGRPVRTVVVY